MASMFDSAQKSQADSAPGQSTPLVESGVPGQHDPVQQTQMPDLGNQQNWDTFNQHMLLVVQATHNLGVKLKQILGP